ncbi:hypothetical protein M2119_001183 [Aurantimicrobium minutum]|nr:hypothetical protein [Aurantimicrobium minutum]
MPYSPVRQPDSGGGAIRPSAECPVDRAQADRIAGRRQQGLGLRKQIDQLGMGQ